MSQTRKHSPFFGLSPKQYFFGAVIPAMTIISLLAGIVTNATFGLQFAGVGIAGLGILIWAQQDNRRLWALTALNVSALGGWILIKVGLAGLPEALAHLAALLLLLLIIAIVLKFAGITNRST